MEGKKRMAVLVGCNYPNTKYELHGCINDVIAMREKLVSRFGFDVSHVQVLTDEPGSLLMPTGAQIKSSLEQMVSMAESGDVLFFHFSGHGTRVPSLIPGNFLRQDEAIVPFDFNLITDVDFRHLVNRLPKGASFTMLSDSCHSGGLIDKEKEQIGPSTVINGGKLPVPSSTAATKAKTIPFQSIVQHLSSLTNINTPDIGTHLLESFGADASLKFRLHPRELDSFDTKKKPDVGILLSGCQANESSADMNPFAAGAKAYGAFSNAIEEVLNENSAPLSNKQLVVMARERLKKQAFAQHPCLYCSDENAEATFLHQQPTSSNITDK